MNKDRLQLIAASQPNACDVCPGQPSNAWPDAEPHMLVDFEDYMKDVNLDWLNTRLIKAS